MNEKRKRRQPTADWIPFFWRRCKPHGTFTVTLSQTALFCQALALPHKYSNPKQVMPHNKNLTQICLADGGIGEHHGVN
ncbi:MAG: hypothetical protein LBS82_03230, partial [Spirochaetaceae bacterium]|nr:hypothetical protein [Spirochaetaceae bacterium]